MTMLDEDIEVVYKGRKNGDNKILLPPTFELPRSDQRDDLKEKIDEEQKRLGRRWFYLILLCTIVFSSVAVAIILTRNMSSNGGGGVPAVSASLTASSSTPQPSPSAPPPESKQPTPTSTTRTPEPSSTQGSPSPSPILLPSGNDEDNPSPSAAPQLESKQPTPAPTSTSTSTSTSITPEPSSAREPSPSPDFLSSGNDEDYTVILESGASMSRNEIAYSPNGLYSLYMSPDQGDLIMYKDGDVVWRVNGEGAATLGIQTDGNLMLKRADRTISWKTNTSGNHGASLQLDNVGQLTVSVEEGTPIWLEGVPQGRYSIDDTVSLDFPIRGAFYYPWFPETWSVNGSPVKYTPFLGHYRNGHSNVQRAHVDMLEYANVDVAIASWWGPDHHLDRSRITNLLNKSKGKSLKWTIYHEEERHNDQTIDELRADMAYLKKWFAWHENWAHVDGRPLIFVYNDSGCDVSERWMAAANGEWHVVLKRFRNDDECPVQPDHWHQYGPAHAVVHEPGSSFAISPGFWKADENTPVLARLSTEEWRTNVMDMVSSNEPWQLITTFNEWGEGTAVEGATEWAGSSGYGQYVDVLHAIQ